MRSTVETFTPDVPYRVRQRLGPYLTHLARALGQPQYRLRETEYVGTVQQSLEQFTATLQEGGFDWDPLAWYHRPPVGSEPNGSWTYRRSLLGDRQLHVILVDRSSDSLDVFAHEEYNWLRHPIRHLQNSGVNREAGRDVMRRWLESRNVAFETKSRRHRRARSVVRDLQASLRSFTQ